MDQKLSEWLDPLKLLVNQISQKFSEFFERLQCTGQVTLTQPEDKVLNCFILLWNCLTISNLVRHRCLRNYSKFFYNSKFPHNKILFPNKFLLDTGQVSPWERASSPQCTDTIRRRTKRLHNVQNPKSLSIS
jgi:hypothetical protein